MGKEADWYEPLDGKRTRCTLCPQGCLCADGDAGLCLGRVNHGGRLVAESYARPASVALDPIEKKPLYHFHPGSEILSLGTYGCNLKCVFCQNHALSQTAAPTEDLNVGNAVRMARGRQAVGIAYTYNEPAVWFEYVRDLSRACQKASLQNVLVTNGYINEGPLDQLLETIDAMNIDIKSFRDAFYRELCGGRLAPVLAAAKQAAAACHVEITNLLIPGKNDDPAEQEELAAWIAEELGPHTPVHLSAYTPRYKLSARPTTAEDLASARERFAQRLDFVYLGNVRTPEGGRTACPKCHATVIERDGYRIAIRALGNRGTCAECGADLHIVH